MSVWLTIPSKRPAEQVIPVLEKWRAMGYKIALRLDEQPDLAPWYTRSDGTFGACPGLLLSEGMCKEWSFYDEAYPGPLGASLIQVGSYPGYAAACNSLIKAVIGIDHSAEWFVCAGDDTYPDPNNTADEIADSCARHFSDPEHESMYDPHAATFGVMQPTGDPFAGRQIERICGSPWIGREFVQCMYGGNGPYWPEYKHMFVDEELQEVAKKHGVLWQRQDLTQHHEHWTRNGDVADYSKPLPAFLREANSPEHWKKYGDLFRQRKAAGFPGSEPLVEAKV